MPKLNMVQAINLALREEMQRDKNVVILGEDVGRDGGVFRVTEGLLEEFGAERVIDTPLAESVIAGSAIGMALYGLKPIAEIQFMGFIYPAIDQIFSHAARVRSRSRGRFTCPIVVRAPYGAGIKAPELHSESTEALFCHMPGVKVVVPSSPYNAKGLLISSIRDPDPVIFLESTRLYRLIKEEVPEGEYAIPLGKARVVQEGKDITVISWGSMLHRSLQAVGGFDAEVIDLMTLNPFDEETIFKSVKKTGRVMIVHEASKTGGFGAEISATIAEDEILYLKAPIIRVTGYDVVMPLPKLEDYYIPTVERIRKGIEEAMKY
ncbi:MAG: 2-oxoisovalerate dehydrogenase [Nitrospirae bacterium GWC2_46_6]|nr:MAG: 2-oxoisovalerate dehydrogenase [Nitrospirae bacterium GWA2_46_11]OGW22199.1 MAG: 2-oxoisovalerate dehydrogenase [Nitrospirae bacterium GWC2_46_6]OGW26125.1 MAG: 2-oxoisovalerate dehydrogenase [Nitrospirae bacterium GWB2_47_37]HAK89418.1 alpha-ketoacid dehydrogenase subunit beta [Nitrospiraceae bacterium]HCZ11189.1 alpha-ketoacid dehydrogenase subunit beta [Nitrospiraceae bacterium]